MSTHEPPYFCDALVLDEDEFHTFMGKYATYNNLTNEEAFGLHVLVNANEAIFNACSPTKYGELFSIEMIDEPITSDIRFIPFFHNGQINGKSPIRTTYEKVYSGCMIFAIPTQRSRHSIDAIENPPYTKISEIMDEFKTELSGYLPKDFDYESHIGILVHHPLY